MDDGCSSPFEGRSAMTQRSPPPMRKLTRTRAPADVTDSDQDSVPIKSCVPVEKKRKAIELSPGSPCSSPSGDELTCGR